MGDRSGIEWTDATWNPLVGCSKVGSPGCEHCYAIGAVHRGEKLGTAQHAGLTVRTETGLDWTGEVRPVPHLLDQPIRWKRPRRIFVNSLSDLFHPEVSDDYIAQVFAAMARAPQHTFQLLTKRSQRLVLLDVLAGRVAHHLEQAQAMPLDFTWPLPNVWVGVSIETNRWSFRAGHLRAAAAAVRWVSAEPLIGPLDALDLEGIDWVVAGGESGPGARPMHPDWARDLRDRCAAEGVAFHFKQWGGRTAKANGRTLDGRTWDEHPAAVR